MDGARVENSVMGHGSFGLPVFLSACVQRAFVQQSVRLMHKNRISQDMCAMRAGIQVCYPDRLLSPTSFLAVGPSMPWSSSCLLAGLPTTCLLDLLLGSLSSLGPYDPSFSIYHPVPVNTTAGTEKQVLCSNPPRVPSPARAMGSDEPERTSEREIWER